MNIILSYLVVLCLSLQLIYFESTMALDNCNVRIVSRSEWNAKDPKSIDYMPGSSVPYVIIHHSASSVCTTERNCIQTMKSIQQDHQKHRGWNDIGYSFTVGGDGNVYEGRGWRAVGAHAPGYNSKSIGICILGSFKDQLPSAQQLEAVKKLIDCGVRNGHINSDYKLLGHRQVKATACPGNTLYNEIQRWPHFSSRP